MSGLTVAQREQRERTRVEFAAAKASGRIVPLRAVNGTSSEHPQ